MYYVLNTLNSAFIFVRILLHFCSYEGQPFKSLAKKGLRAAELAALEHLEKHRLVMGLAPAFLIESSSFR